MPYSSPAQHRFMYSQRPDMAQGLQGEGGGYMNGLSNKYNVALGGYKQPAYDPYMQQARMDLMQPAPITMPNKLQNPLLGMKSLNRPIDTMSGLVASYSGI